MKRTIVFGSDDPQKVWERFRELREMGEEKLAFVEVHNMIEPPITKFKFVILRVIED